MITRRYRYSINKLPWCVLSLAENQSVEQTIFYTVYHFPTPHIINKKNTFFMSRTTNLDNCSNVPWHQRHCMHTYDGIGLWKIGIFDWFSVVLSKQLTFLSNSWPLYQGQTVDLSAGWFFLTGPPKKIKYVKPRLGVSTLT